VGNYAIGAITSGIKNSYGPDSETGLLRGLQAGYGFIGLCALICAISGCILYKYLKARKELI
jgi:DHA1 family purine base/nucleoside efflux pump-like MFS transporter